MYSERVLGTYSTLGPHKVQGLLGTSSASGPLEQQGGAGGPILVWVPLDNNRVLGDLFYPGSPWTTIGCWGTYSTLGPLGQQ